MDTDIEQVKDCMIKWVKHFGYNIVVSMVEYMKGLKFIFNYNL